MKTKTNTALQHAIICDNTIKSGNMKVEHCTAHTAELSAATDQIAASQGHEGIVAHPLFAGLENRTPIAGKESALMNDHNDAAEGFRFTLNAAAKPSVKIDTAKYQAYLDDPALTEEQKEEIVTALWSIITAFVDLGFGVHPAQEVCGKPQQALDVKTEKDSNESKPVDLICNKLERASDDT